jgi:radical SAM superfamily enzyme YgiQ (UPF0313 family)
MKKRKVLLVNPNQMKPPVTPVALDYLAQSLEERGFAVEVLDLAFSSDAEADIRSALKGREALLIGVTVRNLDDSYLASQDFCLERIKGVIDLIKAHSPSPLVLGGVGFSISPEAALSYCNVDLGIRGEGEQALPLLAKRLGEGGPLQGIPGLIFKEGQNFRRNRMHWFALQDADLSSRSALDHARYLREGGMVGFESKRGCDQGCTFCADPIAKGKKVRLRDPAQVADELARLYEKGIDHFHTCDSEFNVPEAHAIQVCQQIVRRGLGDKIRWFAYLSPQPFSEELAIWMRRAGCAGIDFGVDHGEKAMLLALGRSHTAQDVRRIARLARGLGFSLLFDLLLGGPGETRKTLRAAIELMKEASPDRVGISLGVRMYPGTRLFGQIKGQGSWRENPHLRGAVEANPGCLRPIFYLSADLGEDIDDHIDELVAGDKRFLFGNRKRVDRNYNYNDNSVLVKAIAEGHRGAFWDILRRISPPSHPKPSGA